MLRNFKSNNTTYELTEQGETYTIEYFENGESVGSEDFYSLEDANTVFDSFIEFENRRSQEWLKD